MINKEYKPDLIFTPKEYHGNLFKAFLIGILTGIGLTSLSLIIYYW